MKNNTLSLEIEKAKLYELLEEIQEDDTEQRKAILAKIVRIEQRLDGI